MKTIYQQLYADKTRHYGDARHNRCPSVRLYPKFRDWVIDPIIDLGCGRGQLVEALRMNNKKADGIDFIKNNPDMIVSDITQPLDLSKYKTAICIDVIEHIEDEGLRQLFLNMLKTDRQIIAAHNGKSFENLDQDLHINKKTFIEWRNELGRYFKVVKQIPIHSRQVLFFTIRK